MSNTNTNTNTTFYPVQKTADISEVAGMVILPVSRNDGKKGKSGIAVKLPEISQAVLSLVYSHPDGAAFFVDCLDGIRSKIASDLHKNGKQIRSDNIGLDAILAALRVENQNQRMTKDAIGAWFDSDLSLLLIEAITAKIGAISSDKMSKILDGYKADFQTLAMRNIVMGMEIKTKLTKAIALLPDDYESIIGEKVIMALNDINADIGDAL